MNIDQLKQQLAEKENKIEEITMADLGNHIACPFCKEKDKRIKELEQNMLELQELDNKRAFRLYCMLYDMLEEQDPENVASRIDFMTSENYADICELYKTAKNLKQHDRELVKEVCEKIKNRIDKAVEYYPLYESVMGCILPSEMYDILDQIQKELEGEDE